MKRESWTEFDLYGKIAPIGSEIARLLEEERRSKDDQREQKKQEREQKQQELQSLMNAFIRESKLGQQIIEDKAMRQMMLAQLLPADAICEGRSTQCKDYAKGKNGLQRWYYGGNFKEPQGKFQQFLKERVEWMASVLNLAKPQKSTVAPRLPDLATLPPGSWAIQLTFTLRKPYISKDDTDFYILDNPVKKEHVFKVPYVAASQWKGALRATMVRDLVNKLHSESEDEKQIVDETQFVNERLRLYRLFGNEKDGVADFLNRAWALHRVGPRPEDEDQAQEWEQRFQETARQVASEFEDRLRGEGYRVGDIEGFQGRLHFYPTFFDKIGLEVINPHDRETGAGKNPIYFEAVPADTKGVFTLLYVPLGAGPTDERTCTQDLAAVARGVQAMLTKYGFGAKTSSGFGVAKEDVEGEVMAHFPSVSLEAQPSQAMSTSVEAPLERFLKYLDESGEVKAAFKGSGEGGLMSNKEYREKGEALGGGTLSEFKAFRTWYSEHGEAWRASQDRREERFSNTSAVLQRTFGTLDELGEIAHLLQSRVAVSSEE